MPSRPPKEFRWYEGLSLFLSCIAIQLCSEVMVQWGSYFYSPPEGGGRMVYVAITLAGLIFVIGIVFSSVSDALISLWSDRTSTRPSVWRPLQLTGRRRPFIFWGSIGMTVTGIIFWYPPVHGQSMVNFVYATVVLCIHWGIFFSMCVVPFNALGPEIARSKTARVRVGTWIAAGMLTGLAVAEMAPGYLVTRLDPARHKAKAVAVKASPDTPAVSPNKSNDRPFSPVGYQRMAIIFSIISLLCFQLTVWVVRERYHSDTAAAVTPPLRIVMQVFSNRVFLMYVAIFFLFNIGYLAAQRVLPYWAEVGLHGDEATVTVLMGPFILGAILGLALTNPLSARIPVKWLLFLSLGIITSGLPFMYLIGISSLTSTVKITLGAALFGYCGIGQGIQYVLITPMIGELIDLDEQRTGERREAVYQSLSGFVLKVAQALSFCTASLSMHFWGNSVSHPTGIYLVGPIAGFLGILGMAVCWRYPVLHVAKEAVKPEIA